MDNHFSVITTSYNDESIVKTYLECIVNQTLPPSEIIIVDGGSKDNTCLFISEYAKTAPIPIILIEDGRLNIAQAFNIGIKRSNNDYVLISCMGNQFCSSMCEDLYKRIQESHADSSYGLLLGIDKGPFSYIYNRAFISIEGTPVMSNRSVMYKKTVFDKIGFFIENFKYAGEDSEFLNRFKANSLKSSIVDKPVVFWETPNSWDEYKKQCKNYAIAELQHESITHCLFTLQMIQWYVIFLVIMLAFFSIYYLLGGLALAVLCLSRSYVKKKSFKAALLYETWAINKIYYSFRYIKYLLPKNRVTKLSL